LKRPTSACFQKAHDFPKFLISAGKKREREREQEKQPYSTHLC
jgi:hypothetical protein